MFHSLKRLQTQCRSLRPVAIPASLRTPLLQLSQKSHFASEREIVVESNTEGEGEFQGSVEELVTKRAPQTSSYDAFSIEAQKTLLETYKTPQQLKEERLERMQATFGPNFRRVVESKYSVLIDALHDHKISRSTNFSFQSNLDQYKFADGFDYDVADVLDDAKAISRLSYVDIDNSYIQKKFKYLANDQEHFSKFEHSYIAQDYLKDRPESFVAVFNLPRNASSQELYKLFSAHGKIKNYNLRRDFFESPAVFEVLYENDAAAAAAKVNSDEIKYNGNILYVRNSQDAEYEDPINRTLVVHNFENSFTFQEVLENLSEFGNVMHFEMPIVQERSKLPTEEELERHINNKNITENGKYRVEIKTKKFDRIKGSLEYETLSNVNSLEATDKRPFYDEARALNKDLKGVKAQEERVEEQEAEIYYKKIFGDPTLKVLEAMDATKFKINTPNPYTRDLIKQKDDPSLQYYLRSVEEIKARGSESSTITLNDRIAATNCIENPLSSNLGYCFVTFSSTDEAKRAMIKISNSFVFGPKAAVVLKKDKGHMDFDQEYFTDSYEKFRAQTMEKEKKIYEKEEAVRKSEELPRAIHKFRKEGFGGEFEQKIFDHPVKKDNIEERKTPEEWIQHFEQQEKAAKNYFSEKIDEVFESQVSAQFSNTNNVGLNLESRDEDTEYQLGRTYSTKTEGKDWRRFEQALANNQVKRTEQLKIITQDRKKVGFEHLLLKEQLLKENIHSEDSQVLSNLRQEAKETNPSYLEELQVTRIQDMERRVEAGKRRRYNQEARRRANLARIEAAQKNKEPKEEDMYFDPFKKTSQKVQEKTEISYEEKKARFTAHLSKLYNADYSERELEEGIEKIRKEYQEQEHIRKYFSETDKNGNQYISQEDEARFEEEGLPEDPEARFVAKQQIENKKRLDSIKQPDLDKNEKYQPLGDITITKGLPIESYEFKPSQEVPTIDDFIAKMKFADPQYTFEKSFDEDGKEIIIKVLKNANQFNADYMMKNDGDLMAFTEDLISYLRENGIPEEELTGVEHDGNFEEMTQYAQQKRSEGITEVDKKIIELLLKRFPVELVEEALNPNLLKDIDSKILEMNAVAQAKQRLDDNKALTKEDFVKFASQVHTTRGEDGKIKKSRYDIV